MSHPDPTDDKLARDFDDFIKTLDVITVCPYCGNPVDRDWPICCDENHSEEVYDDGENILRDDDGSLEKAFIEWCKAKEAASATGAKYEK